LDIGSRIRTIRLQQGRTLTEIAAACDLSKSLISKIETGKVVPALATLSKIAAALGVRLSVLMEDGGNGHFTITPNVIERPDAFVATDRGYTIYAVAPQFPNKKMMPVLVYGKQGEVKDHSVQHTGEELIMVLEGELAAHIGADRFTLNRGESVYFHSGTEHGFVPISDHAVYLNILVE
jgi:transcriptional regulator with XRE-family HTH domain